MSFEPDVLVDVEIMELKGSRRGFSKIGSTDVKFFKLATTAGTKFVTLSKIYGSSGNGFTSCKG